MTVQRPPAIALNFEIPGPDLLKYRSDTDGRAGTGDFYFGPVVDGKFVQMLPDQAFKTGNFYRVPLLTDRDAYEVSFS